MKGSSEFLRHIESMVRVEVEVHDLLQSIQKHIEERGGKEYSAEVNDYTARVMDVLQETRNNVVAIGVMAHILMHLMYDAEHRRPGFGDVTAAAVVLLAKAGVKDVLEKEKGKHA